VIDDTINRIPKQLPLPFPIDFVITQSGKNAGTYTVTIDWIDRDLLQYDWKIQISRSRYGIGKPYVYGRIGNKSQALHRFILERKLGMKFEKGSLQWSDHKDMNPLNNTRDNLRLATPSQNAMNTRLHPNNTSGFRGVSWNKQVQAWVATIYHEGLQMQLGKFDTPEAAYEAYCKKAKELYGDFARVA
jgi:hypothetical protein